MSTIFQEIEEPLIKGQIGVIPTDTIYGLVGSALSKKVVERIYEVRRRTPSKPCIVLVSGLKDLEMFGIESDEVLEKFLQTYWPGKVSVVVPGISQKWKYLHRGLGTMAFRMPERPELVDLISHTGPLIAPSANLEGRFPAKTIEQAKEYFKDDVDFYVDGGELGGNPSTLVLYDSGHFEMLREGAVEVNLPNSR